MFDLTSRYFALGTAGFVTLGGERVTYQRRRFLPRQGARSSDGLVVVGASERLDTIAARVLGDPLQFWRIADASNAMNPFDLTVPGRVLRVPGSGLGANGLPGARTA